MSFFFFFFCHFEKIYLACGFNSCWLFFLNKVIVWNPERKDKVDYYLARNSETSDIQVVLIRYYVLPLKGPGEALECLDSV